MLAKLTTAAYLAASNVKEIFTKPEEKNLTMKDLPFNSEVNFSGQWDYMGHATS